MARQENQLAGRSYFHSQVYASPWRIAYVLYNQRDIDYGGYGFDIEMQQPYRAFVMREGQLRALDMELVPPL